MLDSRAMRIAFIIIVAFASLACSKKQPAAPPELESATEAPETEGSAAENAEDVPSALAKELDNIEVVALPEELKGETPALDAAPTIKVIEPGAEPRAALRFNVAPGFEQKAAIDVGFGLEASVIMLTIRNPQYTVSFDLSMRAKKAKADGSVLVSYEVEGAKLDSSKQTKAKRIEALERAAKGAETLSGSYTLTSRGRVTHSTVKVSEGAPPESHDIADNLRVALLQIVPALPKEPVGMGATWTAHESIMQGGVHVNQFRSFELVSLQNGIAELKVDLEQSAAPQPYENPGKPIPLELLVLSGHGETQVAWDFSKLAPTRTDIDLTVLRGIRQVFEKDGRPQAADTVTQSTRTVDIGSTQEP